MCQATLSVLTPQFFKPSTRMPYFNLNSSDPLQCNKSTNVSIYPGQSVNFTVRLVGQNFGAVSGTVSTVTSSSASIWNSNQLKTVGIEGGNLTFSVYQTYPEINSATLNCPPDLLSDVSIREKNVHRFLPAVINITFKECPFGFHYKNVSVAYRYASKCVCSYAKAKAILPDRCDIGKQQIAKQNGSWVGNIVRKNKTYVASATYCPVGYCLPFVHHVNALPNGLAQDEQCSNRRVGVLCGACRDNFSLVLGSSECHENCSNFSLFLIIPFAIAGFLLVFIRHYLNLTVTSGTVCGLIFYANIMQDFSVTLLSENAIPVLTPILRVFLAWLNLDFGITAYFYSGMGAFGKTMLLSVFPVYIWIISIVIIILSNRYIVTYIGNNAVKVLATLFLLSYSKFIRVAISSLNAKIIYVWLEPKQIVEEYRWTINGESSYLHDGSHVALIGISFLLIILLLPFSISLLCIRHFFSLSNYCRCFSFIDRLMPFYDAYTGPYKDNARFWTGFLLLVRVIFLTASAFDFSQNVVTYSFAIFFCLFLTGIIVCLGGVYKSHYLNSLEFFFLFNIAHQHGTIQDL